MSSSKVKQLISRLGLSPHPEGGYYREVYRSKTMVMSPLGPFERSSVTDIYFLLEAGQVSRWHRVLHDEIYHFYEGAPLELFVVSPAGDQYQTVALGANDTEICYKHHVPGGWWQASRPTGGYSLVGCSVAPGFDFADFSFLRDNPVTAERVKLLHQDFVSFL